jgi:hypothetical protein
MTLERAALVTFILNMCSKSADSGSLRFTSFRNIVAVLLNVFVPGFPQIQG